MENQNKTQWQKETELKDLKQAVSRLSRYMQTHDVLNGVKEDLTFILKKAKECTEEKE